MPIVNRIADLHAEMASAHAASELGARSVNILQRNLAESVQSSFAGGTKLQRRVVKKASTIQRVLGLAVVGEKHGRGGNDLLSYTVAIHFFQADVRIPASGSDVAEHAIADHDYGFAGFGVLDRRPIGSAETRREIRPRFREEMCVNVGDWHVVFAARNMRYFFSGRPG